MNLFSLLMTFDLLCASAFRSKESTELIRSCLVFGEKGRKEKKDAGEWLKMIPFQAFVFRFSSSFPRI